MKIPRPPPALYELTMAAAGGSLKQVEIEARLRGAFAPPAPT